MESFLLDDFNKLIQNKAIERVITPMTVQLCHLLISMERKEVKNESLASLQMVAEELASASEEFIQAAHRLAGDSEEEWLRQEMKPVVESLILSGRNVTLVAQRLHLQPEYQCHRKELVTITQQFLLDTTKVLLLEDAEMARQAEPAASWCMACLDALEAARGSGLAAPLVRRPRGRAAAPGRPDPALGLAPGRARQLLGRCVPALLAAASGHLRHPSYPQLASSRRRIFALTRKSLGKLLAQLQPGAAVPAARSRNGVLARLLRQLLAAPGPAPLRRGLLDERLAAVVWLCLRLAAGSAPPERMHLVSRCHRLLELRPGIDRPPGTSQGTAREALRAATDALHQGVCDGLLRQILDTFTDTHCPLEILVQAALATSMVRTPHDSEALAKSLQLHLDAFHDQARQMVHVAHLVVFCCSQQQTGRDVEAAVAGVRNLESKQKSFSHKFPKGVAWTGALPPCRPCLRPEQGNLNICWHALMKFSIFLNY
ncbi:uncharacterized protein LOC115071584 [Nannospalax galili]|uniref:uncharacterized protein LOC115071584 n=1 Tax=Nannospalax galili TaxID=1026970 RepID=UPI00111BFEFC|nr:uncharacterized protein LOC115071584 [Nannospalax galili]